MLILGFLVNLALGGISKILSTFPFLFEKDSLMGISDLENKIINQWIKRDHSSPNLWIPDLR